MKTADGFTLLELMVALALLGLIALLLSGGVRFGARAWERSAEATAAAERVAAVQAILRRQLERIYPLADRGQPARPLAFSGTAEQIVFQAEGPERLGLGGLRPTVLRRDGDRLVLTWQDRQETLLTGLTRLRIDYYGTRDRREPREWRDTWDTAAFLPGLIRIDLDLRDTARPWPILVVAPAITIDALLD